jgi:UDP-4-amino-4,6-dideoxy-N-acetyl-beta-L-altrosamine transaminase
MTDRYLNYGRHLVDEDDIAAVTEVLRGDLITQGPMVERFERAIAERVGASNAVLVNSGTSALHIACLAAGLRPGDRGVTSALTFVASANAMVYCGATPSLLDIDAAGLGMSPDALRAHLERHPGTKLVMPVLFAGLACDSANIRSISGERVIIEDACHALGGRYSDGQPIGCGAYADMTVFSFHPVKPITMAEGGCIVTNHAEFARQLRLYRSHGIERSADRFVRGDGNGKADPWYYEQQALGYNYRITDIQAALGFSQLKKLDAFIARRREIAAYYDENLVALNNITPRQAGAGNRARSAHHLYVIDIDFAAIGKSRAQVFTELGKHRVGVQVHYIPVYRQPYYVEKFALSGSQFPNCEAYYAGCLSIPIFPGMTDEEVERVVRAVRQVAAV